MTRRRVMTDRVVLMAPEQSAKKLIESPIPI